MVGDDYAADRPTLQALVTSHWPAVYRTLHSLTNNHHDTEDLTQETFLRAMIHIDTLQPGSNTRAWLLRIATNAYYDVYRKRRRVQVQPLRTDLAGAQPDPGHDLEVAEECARLRSALEELSATTRLVFHLRVTEELSFRAIGTMLNLSEETARWHMHQARTRLVGVLGAAAPTRE